MQLKYLYPHWGSQFDHPSDFIAFAKSKGFDGIEINIQKNVEFEHNFLNVLNKEREQNESFICVLQEVSGIVNETPKNNLNRSLKRLNELVRFSPNFINSHTGRDYYSFDENCRFIEAIENFSVKNGIPVYHEIHRGRFTFHSRTTLKYIEVFPDLKFVGDLSHWCVVSESMLENQENILNKIIPHIHHIHARIGFEQSPQVNNPFAPEWKNYLEQFIKWWQSILKYHKSNPTYTITPEFGPYPYMPQEPFTKTPLAIQSELNCKMKDLLKTQF